MLININEIKGGSNRREALPEDVKALAESIAEIGMMNPITVDLGNNLVAGLHRLEAAKLLGWTEIECNVRELDELHAELAEIDENVVRTGLSELELGELLARRKKIYEALHPETKHGGDRKSEEIKSTNCRDDSAKSFAEDTAEKMGVSPRTVERSVQIAENLTPEAKEVLRNSDRKITKQKMMVLARTKPEKQKEAAEKLVNGETNENPVDNSNIGTIFFNDFEKFFVRTNPQIENFPIYYEGSFLYLNKEQFETIEQHIQAMQNGMSALLEKMRYSFDHAAELLAKHWEESEDDTDETARDEEQEAS